MLAQPSVFVGDKTLSSTVRRRSRWIVGPLFDQWFLIAGWFVPFFLWDISVVTNDQVALLLFFLIDKSHVAATWTLSLFDRPTMRVNGRWYFAVFSGLVAAGSFCAWRGGIWQSIWISLFLYWGPYHVLGQHYGFLRLYQSRDGDLPRAQCTAEVRCLYAGALFPYLLNMNQGWAASRLPDFVVKLWCPDPLLWAVGVIFGVTLAQTLYYAVQSHRDGRPAFTTRHLHLLLAITNFWVGLLVVGRYNVFMASLFITSYHNIQYNALVWWVARKRYRRPSEEGSNPIAWLFLGRTPALFILLTGAIAFVYAVGQGILPFTQAFFARYPVATAYLVNFMFANFFAHYAFDARLWRLRSDHRLREDLAL